MAKKENKNKSFILRIDSDTMDAVEKWAADEFRSINGQLQWIISEALRKNGRLKKRKIQVVEEDKPDENPEEPTT
ncbi:Arc family DNA-binding protein [Hoylesella buccalis]|uniref:Arc family DNA-binding protein n=1 Tax=Hoylesella buccalis TaxID=28127 RepID=UPI001D05EE36|nr:Arc family DNA-binding protein [Hoylesella buccalis]MCB6901187.1 Arc family DNA-binding protein [Hoylesella buccalis]